MKHWITLLLLTSLIGCERSEHSEIKSIEQTAIYEAQSDADAEADALYSHESSNNLDLYDEEIDRRQIADAKRAVVDAQNDLNHAVRALAYGDWQNDLPTVQLRLRTLEDANSDLSSLDSSAASEMDFEISRMKREIRRLEDENWRDVVPDIERRNRSIGIESDDIESSIEE